jgi:hypothetical protein
MVHFSKSEVGAGIHYFGMICPGYNETAMRLGEFQTGVVAG